MALERVVHQLRGVEELLAADDHLPFGLDARVTHEGYERVQDLGHAATESGRGKVQDLEALQLLRQLFDLLDQRPADEVRVVSQGLVTHAYGLKQGAAPLVVSPEETSHRAGCADGRGSLSPCRRLEPGRQAAMPAGR